VLVFPLPDGFTADRMRAALTAAILRLPEQLRRSLTWDHGREMAEHTNGLLRQYLSKGADLRQLDRAALDAIAAELNGRPRQTLGFTTPSQALAEALR
jgi:IS30 family transposase